MAAINQIQLRRGTSASWETTNPTLTAGEPGFVTDINRLKIGDGTTAWNDLEYISSESYSLVTTVFNNTGSVIPKMTAVYINGGHGDKPTVALAIATSDPTSAGTYGVTAEAINNMTTGKVIVFGSLIDVNTNQFNPTAPTGNVNGSTLYLSPTVAGGLTRTKPSAPNHIVAIGTIVRTHQNEGIIEIRVQNGFELEELHDVSINGITGGEFLSYNGISSLWIANPNLFSSGSNIGVGTSSPGSALTVAASGGSGTIGGAAQTQIFQVNDASGNDYVNLGHFNCEDNSSRGSFMLSNNGTNDAWQDNVMQFFVHGSNYGYGYYGSNVSDAGCAMIVTQGSEITKLQIGNYGFAPIEFFTDNNFRAIIDTAGNFGIGTSTPESTLHTFTDFSCGNQPKNGGTGIYVNGDTGSVAVTDSGPQAIALIDENGLTLYSNSGAGGTEILSTDRTNLRIGIGTTTPSETLDVVGNVNIDGNLTFDSFTESVVANGNSGTSRTLSLASGTVHTCTLTGNCTFTMPTATAGKSFSLFLNTGSGGFTATFTGVRWSDSTPPTITSTASKVDLLSFISDGSFWYGSFSQNYG